MSQMHAIQGAARPKKDTVNIVVVGDPKTGKTTLINTLISEKFSEQVPPVLKSMSIPAELTPDKTSLSIVDTPSDPDARADTVKQLLWADVVMLVAAYDEEASLQRVKSYWFKLFDDIALSAPVVLVVNKSDLAGLYPQSYASLLADSTVEAYIECSSKRLEYVPQAFFLAQHTALYPLRPLYDMKTRNLTPRYYKALNRIFRILDQDHDHILNDPELNDFQELCFGSRYAEAHLSGLKKVIRHKSETGVHDDGLTLEGFYLLCLMVLEKRKADVAWSVLYRFGYGEDLLLRPACIPMPKWFDTRKSDQTCELSQAALNFLRDVFLKFDQNQDRGLSHEAADPASLRPGAIVGGASELEQAFAPLPFPIPFTTAHLRSVSTTGHGTLDMRGWLSFWSLLTLRSPDKALECLAYLGFAPFTATDIPGARSSLSRSPEHFFLSLEDALTLNKSKKDDENSAKSQRTLVHCIVYGTDGFGKASLVSRLLGRPASSDHSASLTVADWVDTSAAAAASANTPGTKATPAAAAAHSKAFQDLGNLKKGVFLVLQSIPEDTKSVNATLGASQAASRCDVICLTHDGSSSSLDYLHQLLPKLPDHIPCVVVQTYEDSTVPSVSEPVDSDSHIVKYSLTLHSFAAKAQSLSPIYAVIAKAALNPGSYRPLTPQRKRRRNLWTLARYVSGITFFALGAFYVIQRQTSSSGGSSSTSASAAAPSAPELLEPPTPSISLAPVSWDIPSR